MASSPAPKKPMPKRILPNKPLPSRPLPSKPSPTPPRSPASPQSANSPYSPSPHSPNTPNAAAKQKTPAKTPPVSADGRVMFMPGQQNANMYTQFNKKEQAKGWKESKKCEKTGGDANSKTIKLKLYQPYDKFFVAEGNASNRGFQVKSITNNEFGVAFAAMGVQPGWRVTKIGNDAVPIKSFPMLKNQIHALGQKAAGKGYELQFDGNPPNEDMKSNADDSKQNGNNKSPMAMPQSTGKSSVEPVNCHYNDMKIVRLLEPIHKYVEFGSVKGPKGYQITAFIGNFGDDLKRLGIDIGWRVTMLGQQDVSNLFTQMIKSKLDVEYKNNRSLTLTFKPPE